MSTASTTPNIFISYAHADEPENPTEGEVQWLSFVRQYLQPAVKEGIFGLWVDRQMMGGADWDPEIEQKLRACHIFILLVSANSMASNYIVDKEIAIIRERQANGDDVYFYPLLLTPTPDAGLNKVKDKNLRPRDAKPFSGFSYHDRLQHMTEAANEIARIAHQIVERKGASQPRPPSVCPAYVHISGLPETAYERLVGRDAELQRLDDAWADAKTNILSLVAEGGAGKSALVNEWLKRLQADNYRGAEAVLGWSFYSQGSQERATSAEQFLDWALEKLQAKIDTTSASTKGEAIAEAIGERRVLLVLDGVEPLQYGLDSQPGKLKDIGLRALLRRLAPMPPTKAHGLVVLTSRLAINDIANWKNNAAPVLDVEQLSDEAGAALLRDNGVWGIDSELKAATKAFGGHPLALGLLASFLKETQFGDVRRRDHIRAYLADTESPRHDHARRVMESYEKEWLVGQPLHRAIMHIVGLFDRPASGDCVRALREKPAIEGLTDGIVDLDEGEWHRALARLRDVRLLAPRDPAAPDALDAHPLVREWFGEQFEQTKGSAWRAAHGRLYEHLRDTTKEGKMPTLADLAPLYQAIVHGCRAGRHPETLVQIYDRRICRTNSKGFIYSTMTLGAVDSDLAAISWFFNKPYEIPVATLAAELKAWLLDMAAYLLRAQGRLTEAVPAVRLALRMWEASMNRRNAAISASRLSQIELLVGEVAAAAVAAAKQSIVHADQSGHGFSMITRRALCGAALHAANQREEARELFADAEQRQKKRGALPVLYSLQGYQYCDLLIAEGDYAAARDRSTKAIVQAREERWALDIAHDTLTMGRAHLGLALTRTGVAGSPAELLDNTRTACVELDHAVDGLRAYGQIGYIPGGLLARAAFRRSVGDWNGAARDLDEVEEIAEPGQMKLHLCDMALERARLALARSAAFAPLNGLDAEGLPRPALPGAAEAARLTEEATANLSKAHSLITKCGYHRRDDELTELEAVLKGTRAFADLPPRV